MGTPTCYQANKRDKNKGISEQSDIVSMHHQLLGIDAERTIWLSGLELGTETVETLSFSIVLK